MSITVLESTWQPLARQLADDIDAVGKLHTPEWRAAVQDVPRHVFVPRYYTDDQDGRSRHRGTQAAVSSSTKPDLMIRMLARVLRRHRPPPRRRRPRPARPARLHPDPGRRRRR